jgi:hypothetical protein
MLDYIRGGIFLEQPTGENAAPAFGLGRTGRAFIDQQLDESALVGIVFPRCGFLARPQSNNDLAEADRFTGFQFDIAGLAIAFVEQTQDRDAFGHRRSECIALARNDLVIGRLCLARFFRGEFVFLVAAQHIACAQRCQQGQQQQAACQFHAASGLHAS